MIYYYSESVAHRYLSSLTDLDKHFEFCLPKLIFVKELLTTKVTFKTWSISLLWICLIEYGTLIKMCNKCSISNNSGDLPAREFEAGLARPSSFLPCQCGARAEHLPDEEKVFLMPNFLIIDDRVAHFRKSYNLSYNVSRMKVCIMQHLMQGLTFSQILIETRRKLFKTQPLKVMKIYWTMTQWQVFIQKATKNIDLYLALLHSIKILQFYRSLLWRA